MAAYYFFLGGSDFHNFPLVFDFCMFSFFPGRYVEGPEEKIEKETTDMCIIIR